jgi:hypothetical protein
MMLFGFALSCLLLEVAASPHWSATYPKSNRRLDLVTAPSTNESDPNCIVGGFDEENPAHIYIGGPCSELKGDTPTADFRWLEMHTFHAKLTTKSGEEAQLGVIEGTSFSRSQQKDTHVQVSAATSMALQDENNNTPASIFVSTSSYLAQKSFSFNTNTFSVYEIENETQETSYATIDACVESCCAAGATPPCACAGNACPTTKRTAEPGDYKYSILAASWDNAEEDYIPGANGNGWEGVTKKFGVGSPKALEGYLHVYQMIDFTNMRSDGEPLEIKGSNGTVLYKNMKTCSFSGGTCNNKYDVTEMSIMGKGWSASYEFLKTYNVGSWTGNAEDGFITTVDETRMVSISAVKFDDASGKQMGMEGATIVMIIYRFDVDGITAKKDSGTFFVYDPSVTSSPSGAQTTSAQTTSVVKKPGSASGAVAQSLHLAFALFFVLRLAANGC